VAFDIAMEPAVAVGMLIHRTALPVFARVLAVKAHLAQAFDWSLRRLVVLVSPLMAALVLAADPLTALLHDRQGHSYAAAALPLKLLAVAALLRVSLQLLYPLMLGSGRPGSAVRLSATTLLLLSAGIVAAGLSFPAGNGIIAVSALWLAIYPLLLAWGVRYLRRHWDIRAGELARALVVPAVAVGILIAAVEMVCLLPGGGEPEIRIGVVAAAAMLAYAGLFVYARQQPY
jgi:O-antigen/teichoic acid export membrane protein